MKVLAAPLVVLGLLAGPVQAEPDTGSDLFLKCIERPPSEDCTSFLLRLAYVSQGVGLRSYCIAGPVEGNELARAFVAWSIYRPQYLERSSVRAAIEAFASVYPCDPRRQFFRLPRVFSPDEFFAATPPDTVTEDLPK